MKNNTICTHKRGYGKKSVTGKKTYTIKFRVTEHSHNLISQMAKLEGCSITDLILYSLKKYPRNSYRLHCNIDYTDLDKLID